MSEFGKRVKMHAREKRFRQEGNCRVTGCGVYYDRTSGRGGDVHAAL